jgi:cell division protein FtsL
MIRLTTLIWLALASLAGVGLFQVKYRVQSLEQDLGQINRQILRDQEAIHVLGAEWSLLNEPARLADLSRRHLELTPFTAAQLAHFSDLPDRIAPPPATPDSPAVAAPTPKPAAPAPSVPMASLPEDDPDVAAVLASMRGSQ